MCIKSQLKIIIASLLVFPIFSLSLEAQEKLKILFLGDSLSAGYGIAKEQAFPSLVGNALAQDDLQVKIINAGVSGTTTAGAVQRLRWYLRAKPDILFLALGGNDGLRGLPTDQMKKNLSSAIKLALQNNMVVVLGGMTLPRNYGTEYVHNFEQVYVELAKEHPLILIPFLLEKVGGNRRLNLPDGIHPTEEGHQIIAQHVLPFIKEAVAQKSF